MRNNREIQPRSRIKGDKDPLKGAPGHSESADISDQPEGSEDAQASTETPSAVKVRLTPSQDAIAVQNKKIVSPKKPLFAAKKKVAGSSRNPASTHMKMSAAKKSKTKPAAAASKKKGSKAKTSKKTSGKKAKR